ncbi:MAG: protein-L-isoaspartate(D-aspartate) O-methyltransferase [Myxococcota bacterium]
MTRSDEALAARLRERMVAVQLEQRGIADPRVLAAMRQVPRHAFVSEDDADSAYEDRALPIAAGQTLSQPYVVALMLEALAVGADERALEIGAGSGYAAAVLSRLAREVYAVELDPALVALARARLAELGYANVDLRSGDGALGWPEHAPFDAILVSAAAASVPPALEAQLAARGRMVIPLGPPRGSQSLVRIARLASGALERSDLCEVQFVPFVGASAPSR